MPTLETGISQLRDAVEPVPAGVSEDEALDAMAEHLTSSGIAIAAVDRAARTITSKPFPGETLEWTCDMFEYREYAYRVAVVAQQWVVGLTCHRSYGWEAHMSGDKVVPADHGVLTECLDTAKYTTRVDAMRSKNVVAGVRKLVRERRGL